MSRNMWLNPDPSSDTHTDVFFVSVYTLSDDKSAVMLRLHTAACDRAAAAALLRKLLELVGERTERELSKEGVVNLGIEDYIPNGKANKPFWARGVDMLGYSMNSFRLANLEFKDIQLPRSSEFIRLKMSSEDTDRILEGCKLRGIKLCGLLAAAGLIAARSSKSLRDEQWEKYSVATLVDCRTILDPVLSCHDVGFYHSAIINSHDVKGGENLWELAKRTYGSYENAKNNNKHFTDMADLNFLMCRAIENPGLTPSSSLRTSVVSVFEDPVIDHSNEFHQKLGLEDYVGCASVHGIGPSIAIFDTIRDGELDCPCVYPAPLHSREQMLEIVDKMKKILLDGCN